MAMFATWCSPGLREMDPGKEAGGNFAASGPASPTRAPCLSEAGLKGPPGAHPLKFSLLHSLISFSGALTSIQLSSKYIYVYIYIYI
uniref:Uncharacterized protein n=1 Tax=Spermophilus dauricus TaxID=99837 RepID=A0A8C9QEX7_SPEDA